MGAFYVKSQIIYLFLEQDAGHGGGHAHSAKGVTASNMHTCMICTQTHNPSFVLQFLCHLHCDCDKFYY